MIENKAKHRFWGFLDCVNDARNYNTRNDWKSNSSGYRAALRKGWLEACCEHMKSPVTSKKRVKNLDTGEIFESARQASLKMGLSHNAVNRAIKKGAMAGGCYWIYCNEGGGEIDE